MRTEGARRFGAFRRRHRLTYTKVALALKVSRPAVYSWEDGSKLPDADARDRIAIWTSGEVTPEMWRTSAAARALSEIKPHGSADDEVAA
jgi:transcriptional regulator with XRE-family HTH domain